MATLTVYNLEGKQTGTLDVSDKVFAVKANTDLLHQVIRWYQANRRQPYAHTKTKGEVRGGGAKPWAQKGTGRARHGSTRNPQWRSGGVAHGPRAERDYSLKLPVTMRRKALAMSLSDKLQHDQLIIVDQLQLPEMKTKALLKVLTALPTKQRTVLVTTSKKDRLVEKAARNLPRVETSTASSLNVEQVLQYGVLILDKGAVEVLEKKLA